MEILIPALKIIFVIFITILWFLLFSRIIKYLNINIDSSVRNNPKVVLTGLVVNICIMLSIFLVIIFIDKKDISVLGFALNQSGILFLCAITIITAIFALTFLWILTANKLSAIKPTQFNFNSGLMVTVLLLFIGALMEEILFRGYFALNLIQYGILTAILVSSAIFTIIHFLTAKINIYQSIEWFMGGVALFVIYIASGSIWVAAIAHFIRNFSNVLFLDIAKANSLFAFDKPVDTEYKMFYSVILYFAWLAIVYVVYHPLIK